MAGNKYVACKFESQYSSSLKNAIIFVGQPLMSYLRNSAKKTAVSDGVKSDVAKKIQPLAKKTISAMYG